MRVLGGLLILSIFLGVVLAGHFYLASGLILATGLSEPVRTAALTAIGLLFALLVLQPFAERFLPRKRSRFVVWPASIWMGFAFLCVVVLGISDLFLLLARALAGVFTNAGVLAPSLPLSRIQAMAVAVTTLVLGVWALREGLAFPRVRRVEISLPRWPRERDGFRIVQISDIHIGALRGRAFAAELVARVNALSPDLVAVTGDLVDGSVTHLGDEVAPFADLRASHGVFFVTGNHDHYSGADDWVSTIGKLGLSVLRNRNETLFDGPASVALAGVDDHRASMMADDGGEDLDLGLAGIPADRPVVLLAHDPSTFKQASRRGVDLQLSGHTHAGQIWPFRYLVRIATPFVQGIHRRGASTVYVSRGTGFWGPPMRLGAPAEITELCLRRAS